MVFMYSNYIARHYDFQEFLCIFKIIGTHEPTELDIKVLEDKVQIITLLKIVKIVRINHI